MRTFEDAIFDIIDSYKALPHQKEALKFLSRSIDDALTEGDKAYFWAKWRTSPNGELPQVGIDLIKHFEGFRNVAYPDAIYGWDVPTIGYGTTRYANGDKVGVGDTITRDRAEYELKIQCNKIYWPAVLKLPYANEMAAGQLGALLSFAYNLGAGFYGANGFATITKVLREKDWGNVPAAMYKYRNPGTVAEAGLARRRLAEGHLWETGELKFD